MRRGRYRSSRPKARASRLTARREVALGGQVAGQPPRRAPLALERRVADEDARRRGRAAPARAPPARRRGSRARAPRSAAPAPRRRSGSRCSASITAASRAGSSGGCARSARPQSRMPGELLRTRSSRQRVARAQDSRSAFDENRKAMMSRPDVGAHRRIGAVVEADRRGAPDPQPDHLERQVRQQRAPRLGPAVPAPADARRPSSGRGCGRCPGARHARGVVGEPRDVARQRVDLEVRRGRPPRPSPQVVCGAGVRDDVDAEARALDLVHRQRGAVERDRALGRDEAGEPRRGRGS